PTDPDRDCGQCEPEHFLNREQGKPHCELCVSCKPEYNLVEKVPCSFNSRRVCECQAGLFCKVAVVNSCVQCISHTVCKPGFGVLARGKHPTHASQSPLALAMSNRPKDSDRAEVPLLNDQPMTVTGQHSHTATKPVTSASILMSDAASDDANWTTSEAVGGSDTKYAAGTSPTSDIATEETAKTGEVTALIMHMVKYNLVEKVPCSFNSRRVCECQAGLFCKVAVVNSCVQCISHTVCKPGFGVLARGKHPTHASQSPLALAMRCMLKADKESEERELLNRTPIVETNNNLVSISEKNPSPDSSLTEVIQSTGNATDYPADSRVRDHTNNRIDKIYIMKADTVIVGSISEVPVSKNCAVRGCENDAKVQENMEENELAMHYPQQETESFPGSDVMIPVEEEGKEFHHPTTATEK
uniref:TNFR-Cys domain-containing protein n=1 Tax=Chelonoidis abingdonii TaxID=106734 RepID=A0A8C0QIP3_CHEAB